MSDLAQEAQEAAETFARWACKESLLAKITGEECAELANAFSAGWILALHPDLRLLLAGAGSEQPVTDRLRP